MRSVRMGCVAACAVWAVQPVFGWNPSGGDWSKTNPADIRVMTWNVEDGICRTAAKVDGFNSWTGLVRIVASLQPDVVMMQETGDNEGNGTGTGVDSTTQLLQVMNLFLHGGTDPFMGGAVTSYVQLHAPDYDLPYIYVSTRSDGYNRNLIASRFPFTDLNGDGLSTYPDLVQVLADQYAPGGVGGIRGFPLVEIGLPDEIYRGDLVIGTGHLRSGGQSSDYAERLAAAQNVAYVIDYWYNGAGTGTPDPNNKIIDFPQATSILAPTTPVIVGGDWNEDELNNGRKGPAEWITMAQTTGTPDGTDRDRGDMTYDDARNPVNNSRVTQGSSSKLDYLAWQDSIAHLRRAFIFNTGGMPVGWYPAPIATFPLAPSSASGIASDHRPVIADFALPRWADGDGDGDIDSADTLSFTQCLSGPVDLAGPCGDIFDFDGDGDVDLQDFITFAEYYTAEQL